VIVPPNQPVPVSFAASSGLITQIVESTGTTCTEMEVPWLFDTPFQENYWAGVADVHGDQTRIVYYSLMEPVGPAITPVYPSVNIYNKAGPGFALGVPDLNRVNQFQLAYQGGLGELSVGTFGEIVDDLLLLTRRSVNYATVLSNNMLTPGHYAIPIQPWTPSNVPGTDILTFTNFGWSYCSYLASAFLGESGSYVYKYIPCVGAIGFQATVGEQVALYGGVKPVASVYCPGDQSSRGAAAFDSRRSMFFEVRAPDRNTQLFRYTGPVFDQVTAHTVNCMVIDAFPEVGVSQVQANVMVWVSGGDDFKVGGWLCAPPLTPRW